MKERLKRRQPSAIAGIGIVLGLVAGIILFSMLMSMLAIYLRTVYEWNTTFVQYVEFVVLIVFGIWIVRRWLTEYEYDVIGDELIVGQFVGRRGKTIYRVALKDIAYIGPEIPAAPGRPQRLTFKHRKRGVVYIQSGGKSMYFSPSEELLNMIEARCVK